MLIHRLIEHILRAATLQDVVSIIPTRLQMKPKPIFLDKVNNIGVS